jgi:hypothetical protein
MWIPAAVPADVASTEAPTWPALALAAAVPVAAKTGPVSKHVTLALAGVDPVWKVPPGELQVVELPPTAAVMVTAND